MNQNHTKLTIRQMIPTSNQQVCLEETFRWSLMTMNPLKSSVILDVLDALFALTLVAPAVVGYWRGTWNLMGHYVYTDNEIYSSFVSLAIGFIGMFIFCLAQGPIKRYLEGKDNFFNIILLEKAFRLYLLKYISN